MWRVPVGDGLWVTTHGGDAIPPVPGDIPMTSVAGKALPKSFSGWPLARPQCVSDGTKQFHHQVIYARAVDRPDRFARMRDGIRLLVHGSTGYLRVTSARHGRSLSYRVLCGGSSVSVLNVKLSIRDAGATFSDIVTDLIAQGFSNPFAKYWIFYDGAPRDGASGVGTLRLDDSPGADNANNFGPGWAVTYDAGVLTNLRTMMHENGHNLGAVQLSAPNSNKAGHCIDGLDLMCYYESSGFGERYTTTRCRVQEYDCGSDDYFNPRPKRGSYLAKHWNTGSAANRFLAGCLYRTGVLETPGAGAVTPASPQAGAISADFAIPKGCRGRTFSVSAAPAYPEQIPSIWAKVPRDNLGTSWVGPLLFPMVAGTARFPDADVCFYKGTAVISCHERRAAAELVMTKGSASSSGAESGTIPLTATSARVFLGAGAHAVWVFNAV
jgi:hypothetical protein